MQEQTGEKFGVASSARGYIKDNNAPNK